MIVVVPNVLDSDAVTKIAAAVRDGEFVEGKLTATGSAERVKNNLQLVGGSSLADTAGEAVSRALQASSDLHRAIRPHTMLRPLFARYDEGMSYGEHFDAAIIAGRRRIRADVSLTLFLSPPGSYDGGELVIETDVGEKRFKEAAGAAVAYPSGFLHRVEPVTRGQRLVAVTWAQSLVRSQEQRRILHDLGRSVRSLEDSGADGDVVGRIRRCHDDLLRQWSEP